VAVTGIIAVITIGIEECAEALRIIGQIEIKEPAPMRVAAGRVALELIGYQIAIDRNAGGFGLLKQAYVRADGSALRNEEAVPVAAGIGTCRPNVGQRTGPEVIVGGIAVGLGGHLQIACIVKSAEPYGAGKQGRYTGYTQCRIYLGHDVLTVRQVPPYVTAIEEARADVVDGQVIGHGGRGAVGSI